MGKCMAHLKLPLTVGLNAVFVPPSRSATSLRADSRKPASQVASDLVERRIVGGLAIGRLDDVQQASSDFEATATTRL
jgi:hypothetical protein